MFPSILSCLAGDKKNTLDNKNQKPSVFCENFRDTRNHHDNRIRLERVNVICDVISLDNIWLDVIKTDEITIALDFDTAPLH